MAKDSVKLQEFRVAFRDIDMNGEMFRAAYVSQAEQAVTDFWRRRKGQKDDPFFAVTKITCSFHLPLKLGDVIHTRVGISKIGGKSAAFLVHFMRDKEAAAEAEVQWTACDPESREPVALPEDLRDWLYQYLD